MSSVVGYWIHSNNIFFELILTNELGGLSMKAKWLGLTAAMVLALGVSQAQAADMPPLAKKSGCTACHAIDKKVVGPAWADVAKKYKGDGGAKAALVDKVKKGGKGN
ncbi:MAG: hypothetical protein OEX00_02290, partial [Gammaproteobacteria bacterium]|nr:hypothetical protein [Gammaproteobacteria bacterium]